MVMSLRIEVFVADVEASGEFYRRVMAFDELSRQPADGPAQYLWMGRGSARIGIGAGDAAIDPATRHTPRGTEIVLEVDDLEAELARVQETGWPIAAGLQTQPWGLRDFRLHDPDGYYLRITSRRH